MISKLSTCACSNTHLPKATFRALMFLRRLQPTLVFVLPEQDMHELLRETPTVV